MNGHFRCKFAVDGLHLREEPVQLLGMSVCQDGQMSRWAQQLLALVETQSPFQPVKRGCCIDEVKRRWLAAVFLKTGADVFLVRVLLTTDGHQMLTRIDTLLLGIPGFEKTCCLAGAAANLKNSDTSLDGCMKQNPVSN